MAYVDELLGRDEQVVYVARQHPFTLFGSVMAELFLIALLIAAAVLSQQASGAPRVLAAGMTLGEIVLLICVVISLVVLVSALIDYLRWNSRQYVITDQRVIHIEGVLNKQVADSSLEKINDLELRQTWLGRIFDYGDIDVVTASDIGVNHLRRLAHPIDFKKALLEAKHNLTRGYLDPPPAAYAPKPAQEVTMEEIQQRLVKLVSLRDQGLISKEEFDAKKRELLSRI